MTRAPRDNRREAKASIQAHPFVLGAVLVVTLAACARSEPAPRAPEATAPSTPAGAAAGYPSQPGYPQQQPYPYASAPAPPPPPSTTQPAQPGMPGYPPETPALQASRDFDKAERELAVSTSDCTNACRALGSMDRAAGNICKLSADKPRCDDATDKVRSARDKVKNSCGDCKETSTNRNDPVPSR